jgi:integrase
MWMEELPNGKYKYIERYTDPYTEKLKKVSITLNSKSNQAKKQAQLSLNEKINKKITSNNTKLITFSELLKDWLDKYKHTVKDTTLWRNEWNLKLIRKSIHDDVLVKNIDTNLIQDMLDTLYYKENYSLSTVKQCKSLIKIILDYAEQRKYISTNPVIAIIVKKKPSKLEELKKIENKYLEKDELKKIITVLRDTFKSKRYADLTEFLALTGLRIGEAIALSYDNLKGNVLIVESTLDYTTNKMTANVKTTPKTNAAIRKVDLTKRALEILDELKLENTLNGYSAFTEKEIFFSSRYGNPIALANYNSSLKRAALIAEVDKNVTSHILRHTHISMLAEQKIPIRAIMDRVGHSDTETTTKIYTHVTKNMKEDILNVLESIQI